MKSRRTIPPISTRGLAIWGLAALFFLYEFFLRTVMGSLAHQIIPALHLSAETFAILGSGYYITYGLMQIPVGILIDKFGLKYILLFATLVCAASTFLFAHSEHFSSMFVSRLLMGFGSSFAFISVLSSAAIWLPKQYWGFFAGISQFIGAMGPLLAGGPFIAFLSETHQSWRFVLIHVSVVGMVLALLVTLIVKNKRSGTLKTRTSLIAKKSLSYRLKKLLKNKQAWAIAFYSGAVYFSIMLLGAIWGTDYLQVCGFSQGTAANIISLTWLGYAISCPLLGALSDIAKRRKPFLVFPALTGLLSTLAIIYLPLHHSFWLYAALFFSLGCAASGQNIGFITITEHTHVHTRATSLGLINGIITLFGTFLPPLISYFIETSTGNGQLAPENFTLPLTILPILFLLSLALSSLFIKETYCQNLEDERKHVLDHVN